MPLIEISEQSAELLKTYAALQFPGSVETLGIAHPVHFLRHYRTDGYKPIPWCQNDFQKGYALVHNGQTYKTPVELVLGITGDIPPLPFDPRKMNLYEWFQDDCGIDPDTITVMAPYGHWEDFGVSLIRQDLPALQKSLENHIFEEARICTEPSAAYERSVSSMNILMSHMLVSGAKLLDEELRFFLGNFHKTDAIPKDKIQILENYKNRPNEPFTAYKTVFETEHSKTWAISVTCRGHLTSDAIPLAVSPVLHLENLSAKTVKTVPWPFLDDPLLDSLDYQHPLFRDDPLDPFRRILAYARYKNNASMPK